MLAARHQPLESLRVHGFCIVHVGSDTLKLQQALVQASTALETHTCKRNRSVRRPCARLLRTAEYPERLQARCYPAAPSELLEAEVEDCSGLGSAMDALRDVLEPISMQYLLQADRAMMDILEIPADEPLSSLLDVWRYTGTHQAPACGMCDSEFNIWTDMRCSCTCRCGGSDGDRSR